MQEPGTYQTRISDYRDVDRLDGDATLAAYLLYGRVQRSCSRLLPLVGLSPL